jgi:hypothetical protein
MRARGSPQLNGVLINIHMRIVSHRASYNWLAVMSSNCHAVNMSPSSPRLQQRDTIDEVVASFIDWTHGFVPGLLEEQYVTTSIAVLLDQLAAAALSALRVGDTRECDEAVHDPEWAEVRRLAQEVLEEFRTLGVTIPDLVVHLLRGVESVPASEREPSDLIG